MSKQAAGRASRFRYSHPKPDSCVAWTLQLWQSRRRMHWPVLAPSPTGASVPQGHEMTLCVGRGYLSQTTQHVSVCHRQKGSWGRGAYCFVGQRRVCAFLPCNISQSRNPLEHPRHRTCS